MRIGTVVKVRAAIFDHASMNGGDLAGFDPEGWAAMFGMREDKLVAVLEALTDKGIIVDGRLAEFGDAERHGDASPASQRHRDDRVARRRLLGRIRSERWRANKSAEIKAFEAEAPTIWPAGDGSASPSVTASPLLEEERDQDIPIPSSTQVRASNPWGGAGDQAMASKQARAAKWLENTLIEAQNILPATKFSKLFTAAYDDPRPRWAQLELDRIDALIRQRKGKDPPPSLRREPQFLLPMQRTG